MGQTDSGMCSTPIRGGQAKIEALQSPLVPIEKMGRQQGNISIAGRYTSQRKLEDDYTLKSKVVGTGLNGPVHLAVGQDGRQYAVKSFKKCLLDSGERHELKSEVEIYISVDHPHIARLEQVYETKDDLYLVMEYMAGGELYDRLAEKKQYTEEAGAEAAHQMLLAVAYLHAHNICHRDLKLENFLYESKESNHLKLIDFGFARMCTSEEKLRKACGSIHYVAPEVLMRSYTLQADMWSLGIISHMLLTGSPVFRGSDSEIRKKIRTGRKQYSSRFSKLSIDAQDFVRSLLAVDPARRLTAQSALEHPFVANKSSRTTTIDTETLQELRKYAQASRFRRACLSIMAWSLSQEDRQCLRKKFLELDSEQKGTISQSQFTSMLMDHCSVSNSEAEYLFAALDTAHNKEIRYSEFLAAILRDNVCMREDIVRKTFARFDCDASGTITAANLRTVLGDTFEDADVQELITEADTDGNGAIDYGEFVQYVQNADTDDIPDQPLIQRESGSDLSAASWHKMRPVVFQNSLMVAAANAVIAS